MPVDLASVNISLRQFQKISSGTYNAGEIRVTGRNSLGKVNNHVSRLGQNVVPLSHEEVMVVKTAFVKALDSGGVGANAITRVRPDVAQKISLNPLASSLKGVFEWVTAQNDPKAANGILLEGLFGPTAAWRSVAVGRFAGSGESADMRSLRNKSGAATPPTNFGADGPKSLRPARTRSR